MSVSPARAAAFDMLLRIFRDGGYSSILLASAESKLSEKDRALCHEIVLGVLRTKLKLDAAIERFAKGKKVDLEVRIAAEIGLYQLVFLERVPKYSAVNESVALVQKAKKSSAKGFVNALLRRAGDLTPAQIPVDELERVSIETSHPRWLLEKWAGDIGFEGAAALAASNNVRPRAAFRITEKGLRNGIVPDEAWKRSRYVPGCFLTDRAGPELRKLADEGAIYFQDEGSQLVASLIDLQPGAKFLDVSAAPGSKTTQIATRAERAVVVAGDLYQSRVRTLKANCEDQGVTGVEIVRYDAEAALPFADGEFDAVLLDAPCSGTGTIRSNPEIRYFLKPFDFGLLQKKQLEMLRNASKSVKRGGRLVYSTCSMEPEENEQVIGKFLDECSEFGFCPPNLPTELLSDQGNLRTSPAIHGMDGFFAAVLTRSDR